jgi:hypothetical protein
MLQVASSVMMVRKEVVEEGRRHEEVDSRLFWIHHDRSPLLRDKHLIGRPSPFAFAPRPAPSASGGRVHQLVARPRFFTPLPEQDQYIRTKNAAHTDR